MCQNLVIKMITFRAPLMSISLILFGDVSSYKLNFLTVVPKVVVFFSIPSKYDFGMLTGEALVGAPLYIHIKHPW